MNLRPYMSIALMVALVGCSTAYKKDGYTGGFSEIQLAEDVFEITFEANGFTNKKKAADYALLRAAELTLTSGYPYFQVTDQRDWEKVKRSYSDGTAKTTETDVFGKKTYKTTYSAPETKEYRHPRSSRTVLLLRHRPEGGSVYDAKIVYRSITAKYGIDQNSALLSQQLAEQKTQNPKPASGGGAPKQATYSGQTKDGKRHGTGSFTYASGAKYYGEWRDNKMHGEGTYFYPDGKVFEGKWEFGIRQGYGAFIYKNGNIYECNYENGKLDGPAIATMADGTSREDYWIDGERR